MQRLNPHLLCSFRRATHGFGELPIHYPRLATQDDSSGEQFQWFVENEKRERKTLRDLDSANITLRRLQPTE